MSRGRAVRRSSEKKRSGYLGREVTEALGGEAWISEVRDDRMSGYPRAEGVRELEMPRFECWKVGEGGEVKSRC